MSVHPTAHWVTTQWAFERKIEELLAEGWTLQKKSDDGWAELARTTDAGASTTATVVLDDESADEAIGYRR